MSTGSNRFQDLEEVGILDSQDQFIFFQNSSKKVKKVSRQNLAGSTGFGTSIPGVVQQDTIAPATPTGLALTTRSEIDTDGTEKIFITAKISPNTETDLDRYGWYIRRVTGYPEFSGGVLTGYSAGQIYEASLEESQAAGSVGTDGKVTKEWTGLKPNTWYQVRVCAIDKQGNASSYTAENSAGFIETAKDTSRPAAPTSVTITSAIKSIFLNWTNATDDDWAFVKIYRNTSNTPPTIGGAFHASIAASSFVDENLTQGTTYYYWLTSVDNSGNESSETSTVVSATPGTVAATDISSFAVTATKLYTNTIILSGDVWTDNSPTGSSISWNTHTLVYGGNSYDIISGSTNLKFVYWAGILTSGTLNIGSKYIILSNSGANFTGVGAANNNVGTTFVATGTTPTWGTGSLGSLSYLATDTNPSLKDGQFMIATNENNAGFHDLAWNALANAVIGSAYIQDAAITNAKIFEMTADKIRTATLSAQTITLAGSAIIRSDGVTNSSSGNGFYLEGVSGSSILGIGDLSETNAFLKWSTAAATLKIKGELRASSGWFGTSSTNGVIIDSNGLEIKGTGAADAVGRIKANIDWNASGGGSFTPTSTAGFYLGRASNQYRFFIGNTGTDGLGASANSLYWDGSALTITGVIRATSGFFGTSTSVVSVGSGGLTIGTGGAINSSGVAYSGGVFTNTGFYLGYAGSAYQFFIGNPSGNNLTWNGASLKINGNLTSGTTLGNTGDSGFGLILQSNFGIRRDTNAGIITITAGTSNGASNGAQLELHGNLSTGNEGLVTLQAGTGSISAIRFFTNRSVSNANIGVKRLDIDTDGTVAIIREASYDGGGGTFTPGAGNLEVASNIGVGRDAANGASNTGKLHVATEIAVYNGGTQNIILTGSSGDVTAVQFTTSSSKRFKTKIKKLKNGLDTVQKLNPVSFKRKGKGGKDDIGLIAEEVEKILPQVTGKDQNGDISGLDYSRLTAVLIQAVKELSVEVDRLKNKIK